MTVSDLDVIKNVLSSADDDLDIRSSFNIVDHTSDTDSKKNEFEILESSDYDFEMKNFMKKFG